MLATTAAQGRIFPSSHLLSAARRAPQTPAPQNRTPRCDATAAVGRASEVLAARICWLGTLASARCRVTPTTLWRVFVFGHRLQAAPLVAYEVNVTNTGSMDAEDAVLGMLVPPGAGTNGVALKQVRRCQGLRITFCTQTRRKEKTSSVLFYIIAAA